MYPPEVKPVPVFSSTGRNQNIWKTVYTALVMSIISLDAEPAMHRTAPISISILLFGLLLSLLSGCGRSPEDAAGAQDGAVARRAITGAGSTFAAPIIQEWLKR